MDADERRYMNANETKLLERPLKRCWWDHDWSKWTLVKHLVKKTLGGTIVEGHVDYQRRQCLRCGKIEEEAI